MGSLLRFNVVFILFLFSSLSVSGQLLEGGVVLGGALYSGDLDPDTFGEYLGNVGPSFGAFFRYRFNERINARLGYQFGQIKGDHADSEDPRNLNFQSNIHELALLGEFNILPFGTNRISPYVMGGVGVLHFNPTTEFEGRQVALQPLGTEGQTLPEGPGVYSLWTPVAVGGGGIRYAINESLTLGFEVGVRLTFTDHIDDVSGVYPDLDALRSFVSRESADLSDRSLTPNAPGALRGNASNNDSVITAQFTISYSFDNLSLGGGGRSSKWGCPTF